MGARIGAWPRTACGLAIQSGRGLLAVGVCALLVHGCAHLYQSTPLQPVLAQADSVRVADDGTLTFVRERLEVAVRYMADGELNRQFPDASAGGRESLNPYTYGNWVPRGRKAAPARFTVFRISVKNYTFPKVYLDPRRAFMSAQSGRILLPLTFDHLKEYYRPYNVGWSGSTTKQYQERRDLLSRTLYPEEEIVFSGQDYTGYIVFPPLPADVRQVQLVVEDVVVRFDAFDRPVEVLDLAYQFGRQVAVEE